MFLKSLIFVLTFQFSNGNPVEQVHLSLSGKADEMVVTWLTHDPLPNLTPYALFGLSRDALRFTAKGNTTGWADQGNGQMRYTHRATMQNLVQGKVYYYQVGSSQAMSSIFNFRQPDQFQPLRAAIFGDLSVDIGQETIDYLTTKRDQLDVIIHIGDLAYNLHDQNGTTGDEYMNVIEPFAAYVPYMVFAGNHESNSIFNHIIHRFTMPKNGVYNDNLFWSFDFGNAHFIGLNSEYYPEKMSKEAQAQYKWLREDLEQNSRNWVIVMLHRPWYCSNETPEGCNDGWDTLPRQGLGKLFPGLEDLLNEYTVDMVLYGHRHTYERMWPIYNKNPYKSENPGHIKNAPAPVYILTGSAGCHSHEDPSDHIMQDFSVKALGEYGYTYLTVHNSTHLFTDFVDTFSGNITSLDSFVLEKNST
ncbi:Purple acid phosphatase [Caenorhabditis elegans]|uniref:Purple acid phosphatase n=1 Tax=Caenorhabditis elegans TaxID=6239 RepID=G5EE15_CAEEL|nr:Purple acid phosphatase [Caenorhabditis elegans]CAB63230.3 Purple acid phosphatase [Caenorhabditis elegans]|eukprot:NP_502920.3 Purple acid phosphatase [Caenorhabditis elegans]